MKKTSLLKTMLLLCALIVGSSSAWAQVSSVAPADGKSYVVAASVNNKYYALGTASVSGKTISGTEVTLNSYNKVSTENAAGLTWTLEQNAETPSQFYIKCVRSNKTYYLYKNGTGNTNYNFATNSETNKNYWSFTANSAGTAYTVAAIGRGTNNIYIQYYSEAFRCYSTASDIILLEIGDTPNVDITVAVNPSNESMGTASISGTTITASPNPGYRVSTTTPYSVSPSNAATVVQTGNTFAVTATADCTITINFEAIPTHTLSSAVNPANAGSVVLGASSVCEGANTTIEATANSGYEFTEWEVSGDGATIANKDAASTTITMGTADATVTAKFTAVTTHEINWSVNGTIVKTDNVKEGNALDFSAPTSGIPAGYAFMGWSASTIASPQATAEGITYVTEGTSTADITYYAVLAISNATTVTLAASHTSANTTYGDHTYTDDAGNEWNAINNEFYENNIARYGLNGDDRYFESPTFPSNITSIKIMAYNGSSSSNRNFNICSASDKSTGDLGTIAVAAGEKLKNELTASLEETPFKKFYLKAPSALSFSYIKVTYGSSSNYCTTVPPVEITISAAGWASFSNASEVEIPEGVTAYYAQKKDASTVTLKEITGGYIPANTGVVLSGAANNYSAAVTTTGATLDEDNLLMPWLTAGEPTETTYYTLAVDSNNKPVFKQSTGGTLAAGKAYLVMPASEGARELNVSFDEEGNTTSIDVIRKTGDIRGEVYNLSGQRVAQPTKGLYIVNGKKVVVK